MGQRVAFLLFVLVHPKKGTEGGTRGWGSWRAGERDNRFIRGWIVSGGCRRKGHLGSKGDVTPEGGKGWVSIRGNQELKGLRQEDEES